MNQRQGHHRHRSMDERNVVTCLPEICYDAHKALCIRLNVRKVLMMVLKTGSLMTNWGQASLFHAVNSLKTNIIDGNKAKV